MINQVNLQILPNPAKGKAILHFSLSRSTQVKLDFYDIGGRHIKELLNSKHSAGDYRLSLELYDESGKTLGAGLYFVKITTEYEQQIRQLVILK